MKKFLILIIISASIGLYSCGKSSKEKAQDLAAEYLKGVLYHFDSYEPLETHVDSSFVSLANDKEAIEQTLDMIKFISSLEKIVREKEDAEITMDIYEPDNYSSAYSLGKYNRAKEERDRLQHRLEKAKENIQNRFEEIKARQAELKVGDFSGWRIYHKFKSLNGAKTIDLFGEYILFCDKEFNSIEFAYSKEEYDAISKMMEAIASSSNATEFAENIQGTIY